MRILVSGMHQPATRMGWRKRATTMMGQIQRLDPDRLRARRLRVLRHMSGKVCRAVGQQRLTGYTEPSTGRFTVPGGAMRAMVYRGPYKIRVEEKDIPT